MTGWERAYNDYRKQWEKTVQDYHGIPMVRITLDGMRAQIQACLSGYVDELQKACNEAVKQATDTFDYKKAVQQETERVIQESIRSAVSMAVSDAFRQADVRVALTNMIAQALRGYGIHD